MAKKFEERNPITKWEIMANDPNIFSPNNKVVICGILADDFEYSHRIPRTRETVYRARLMTIRSDGKTEDYIPILVPKALLTTTGVKGKKVEVAGMLRTYRGVAADGHRYKDLNVFVSDIRIADPQEETMNSLNENLVFFNGYVAEELFCNTDKKVSLDVAINRKTIGKADYVPCFVIGENVGKVRKMKVGDHVGGYGRFQSRKYPKREGEKTVWKTAYDILISSFSVLE